MDEAEYERLSEKTLRTIGDAFADVDPDVVDCESAGDVVTLLLGGTRKCVVNTQRPTRQIWLAANARAWHFSWDVDSGKWLDDKGRGELFATLASLVREATGVEVPIG